MRGKLSPEAFKRAIDTMLNEPMIRTHIDTVNGYEIHVEHGELKAYKHGQVRLIAKDYNTLMKIITRIKDSV